MEADEDGRGLHLQPPAPSLPTSILSSSLSSTSDALPTSGDSNISLLPISVGGGNSDDHGSENLDEIDHQLGINFNHLLDIPFHQVPQSDHLQHDAIAVDNQTSSQHQIDLNLDALLSNAGTFYFRHSGHNYALTIDIFTSQIYRFLDFITVSNYETSFSKYLMLIISCCTYFEQSQCFRPFLGDMMPK